MQIEHGYQTAIYYSENFDIFKNAEIIIPQNVFFSKSFKKIFKFPKKRILYKNSSS